MVRYTLKHQSNHTQLFQITPGGLLIARADHLQALQRYALQVGAGKDHHAGKGRRGAGKEEGPHVRWSGSLKEATGLSLQELSRVVEDGTFGRWLIHGMATSQRQLDSTRQEQHAFPEHIHKACFQMRIWLCAHCSLC